jgi:hypothetical protein
MKNYKAMAGVALVFILGAVCGGAATHIVHSSRMEAYMSGGRAAREEALVKQLAKQLDLDNRQLEQIRPVLQETFAGIRKIRQQTRPQVEVLLDESQQRISAFLNPAQRVKFEKIIAERKARSKS